MSVSIQIDIRTYEFQSLYLLLLKGVQCFDYSRSADLLVTGSIDHFVRVFNPFVPAKPVATLIGHDTTVVGIAIAAESKIIFSLGRNLVSSFVLFLFTISNTLLEPKLNLKSTAGIKLKALIKFLGILTGYVSL